MLSAGMIHDTTPKHERGPGVWHCCPRMRFELVWHQAFTGMLQRLEWHSVRRMQADRDGGVCGVCSLRLVIVSRRFWPVAGGTERAIAHLAAALVTRGVEVTLATTQWDESWPDRIDYRGVSVVRLQRTGKGFLGTRRWLRNVSQFLSDGAGRYDAAYVCGLRHDAQAALKQAHRRRAILVLRVDNSGPESDCLWQLDSRGGRQIKRRLMRADALVGTTEVAHRELIAAGYPRDRVHRIVGGVPVPGPALPDNKLKARWSLESVNTLLHCPPETPAAVYTGKLDETGGPTRAINAWRHVARRWPNARLWLVGPGANQSELNRQIDAAGLVGRVVIPGVFADVSELLAAADAAVIGGNSGESHALLLEAMAAGLPIAVNDTPLHRSVIGDESCVHLVPEMDSDALGEVLVRTFHDVDEACQMGAAARALVAREYEIEKVADAHMRLLESLVQR